MTYGADQHYSFFTRVVTIRLFEIHYACLLLTLSEQKLGDVEFSRLSTTDGGRFLFIYFHLNFIKTKLL